MFEQGHDVVMYVKPKIDDTISSKKSKKGNKNKTTSTKVDDINQNRTSKIKSNEKPLSPLETLYSMFPDVDKEIIKDIHDQTSNFDATITTLQQLSQPEHSKKAERPEQKYLGLSRLSKDDYTPFDGPTPGFGSANSANGEYDMLKEHDFLYDRVSVILESALERSDMPEDELDELLSMCEENVCFLIEEEQKLGDIEDEEVFEIDEVTKEVQEYIFNTIKNEQKNSVVNTSTSHFPSLSSSNWNEDTYVNSSKYEKIIDNNRRQAPSKKVESQTKDGWDYHGANNQIHTGIKPGSAMEIIKLCKLFPSLGLNYIKGIYSQLDENFETCQQFLINKHKEAYQNIVQPKKKTIKKVLKPQSNNHEEYKVSYDETVEQILQDYTYQEIRQIVQQLKRIKFIFDRTASQARGSRNYSEICSLENASKEQSSKLEKFSKASKKYVLDKARSGKELIEMDLHGLFWEEAREVVTDQINYISNRISGNESQYKYINKIKNGRHYVEYTIVTGKGNNSRNNVPVLFKNLSSFLKDKNLLFDPLKWEGKVVVYIPI